MKTKAIIAALSSVLTLPLAATNPPLTGGSCSPNECPSCEPCEVGESSYSGGSLDWRVNLGLVKFGPRNSFVDSAREGALEGSVHRAMPRSLDAIIAHNFSTKPQHRSQMSLEFSVDKITSALADPTVLRYNHDAGGEVIELNGFVNQVLTDEALTSIEKLATADGWRLRVWHRSGFALNKTGNLYDIPASTALQTSLSRTQTTLRTMAALISQPSRTRARPRTPPPPASTKSSALISWSLKNSPELQPPETRSTRKSSPTPRVAPRYGTTPSSVNSGRSLWMPLALWAHL